MSEILSPPAEDDAEARSRAEEQETLREVEDLVRRQDWSALRTRLEPLAPESVARILDALPPDDSVKVWELLDKEQGEDVLDEMSEALQESLDEEPDADPTASAGDLQGALQTGEAQRKPVMINAFELQNGRLRQIQVDSKEDLAATAPIWVDLLAPSKEERQWVEDIFGLELPDADDLKDLEESARFYIEDNSDVHLHSDFLLDKEDESRNVPVAFVLHNNILFSMRDEELPVFRLQRLRARIQPGYVTDGKDVLLDLYDADVEYSADALEDIYAELEKVSRTVLTPQVTDDEAAEILSDIAKEEDLNGRIRRNVLDTRRALSFLMRSRLLSTDQYDDARQILRDIDSLDGHTSFLFGKINFLMDATVGFININQNKRVSKLTTISVVFVPLNIIAGIGGMSEFSMMTQGVPWPLSYGAFMVAMGLFGWGTFVTLRWLETRKARKLLAARRAGREG
ncbi:MAG: magnesium transporter CorA [Rhodocyclales bacterium]|nr:magnesium transporter CorA [Rhodocyclales bacterium]